MLEAARTGQWEQLVDIENQCGDLVAAMRSLDAEVILDAVAQARKTQLIQGILADHAEISTLTRAWMSELVEMTQSLHREQSLQKVYGG